VELQTEKNKLFPLFLLILLITLGKYYIYIGFALKPYMVFLFLLVVFKATIFYFVRFHFYEFIMILFYLTFSFTGAFSLYPIESIRIILGIILLIICYFIIRFFLVKYSIYAIEKAIGYSGLVFNTLSLLLYGIALKFQLTTIGGVMMDRDYPRLIGVVTDPNYYIFYNSIFFTYFLCNSKSSLNKIGLILCLITNLLTFSRGGIMAMAFVFIIFLLMSKPIKQFKLILSSISLLSLFAFILTFVFHINFMNMIFSRIQDFSTDGGSGRFELWSRAWTYFGSQPFFGIGAFNFKEYNSHDFSDTHFVHNTFLEILSESGVIGFSIYVLFLFSVCYQLLENNLAFEKPFLFLTFILFLVQMTSLTFFINEVFLLYLAILANYIPHQKSVKERSISI